MNNKKEIDRRAKRYGCDGVCYGKTKSCNRIFICPETRSREFTATVVAVILLVSLYAALIVITILGAKQI